WLTSSGPRTLRSSTISSLGNEDGRRTGTRHGWPTPGHGCLSPPARIRTRGVAQHRPERSPHPPAPANRRRVRHVAAAVHALICRVEDGYARPTYMMASAPVVVTRRLTGALLGCP